MSNEYEGATPIYNIYDPFQYPWMCLNFFLGFWVASNAFRYLLRQIKDANIALNFEELSEDKKRNVITYILQFWVTLVAFILQLVGGVDILFRLEEFTTPARTNCMLLAMLLISVLYIWELCYRQTIGWPLLLHHVITLILLQCATASYFDTQSAVYIRYELLLGFHATTEQISFVALFCFRLSIAPKHHAALFFSAAVQAFVLKTTVTVVAVMFFVEDAYSNDTIAHPSKWDSFWKISFLPLLAMLYGSQLYACKILYTLALKCKRNYQHIVQAVEGELNASESKEREILLRRRTLESRKEHQEIVEDLDDFENQPSETASGHMTSNTIDGRVKLTAVQEMSLRRKSLVDSVFHKGGGTKTDLSQRTKREASPTDFIDDYDHHINDIRDGLKDPQRRSTIILDAVVAEVTANQVPRELVDDDIEE